jgi:hypothetical protein
MLPPGIGPEISEAVMKIFEAAKVPVQWDIQYVGKEVDPRTNSFVTRENLDSVLVGPPPWDSCSTRDGHKGRVPLLGGSHTSAGSAVRRNAAGWGQDHAGQAAGATLA